MVLIANDGMDPQSFISPIAPLSVLLPNSSRSSSEYYSELLSSQLVLRLYLSFEGQRHSTVH